MQSSSDTINDNFSSSDSSAAGSNSSGGNGGIGSTPNLGIAGTDSGGNVIPSPVLKSNNSKTVATNNTANNIGTNANACAVFGDQHTVPNGCQYDLVSGIQNTLGANESLTTLEGSGNQASGGNGNHLEGVYNQTRALTYNSHLEGQSNKINSGSENHGEGYFNTITGNQNHVEGSTNTSTGNLNHIEGQSNTNVGDQNHVEGVNNNLAGHTNHVEGLGNTVNNGTINTHVEGAINTVSANVSGGHVEGTENTLSGNYAHVQNRGNTASGTSSHAQGEGCIASGFASHAGGQNNRARGYQAVFGRYAEIDNVSDDGSFSNRRLFKIGGGTAVGSELDVFWVDNLGTIYGFNDVRKTKTVSANYTVLATDPKILFVDITGGSYTITLPTTDSTGIERLICAIGSGVNTLTIATTNTYNSVSRTTTLNVATSKGVFNAIFDGTKWSV